MKKAFKNNAYIPTVHKGCTLRPVKPQREEWQEYEPRKPRGMCEAGGSRHWCPANCASGTALVMAALETICIPCHYPSGLRARPSLTPRPRLNFPKRHPSVSLSPEASPGRRHLRPLRRRSPFKVTHARAVTSDPPPPPTAPSHSRLPGVPRAGMRPLPPLQDSVTKLNCHEEWDEFRGL